MRRQQLIAAVLGISALLCSCFVEVPDVHTTWCDDRSPKPLFCSDFSNEAYATGWTRLRVDPLGKADSDREIYRSAPRSFWARTTGSVAEGEVAEARLCHDDFHGFPRVMELSLEVRALPPAGSEGATVASLRVQGDNQTYYFDVRATPDGWRAEHSGPGMTVPDSTALQLAEGEWIPLTLRVDLSPAADASAAATGSFVVRSGQTDAMPAPLDISVPFVPAIAELCVGIVYTYPSPGTWDVHVDNVAFDMVLE